MDAEPIPTRDAGLDRLAAFLPRAGAAYAAGRNTDPGPERKGAVSRLSPWLRHRLLTEAEVARAAFAAHGEAAAKFIEEVGWRTYWKGWLEQRPGVFDLYCAGLRRAENRLATEAGLRRAFHDACAGRTGIDCFDSWAREIVARNYLHNHARMWFASIWIFTLRLPWELGADFFLRHLLDGDIASNTLSWRWVAGLHTPGKHYLARAENIARFTGGRFDPRGLLDEAAEPLTEAVRPGPALPPQFDPPPSGEVVLLLHEEDCAVETLDLAGCTVRAVAAVAMPEARARCGVAPAVAGFAHGALVDAMGRAAARFGVRPVLLEVDDLAGWAAAHRLKVVTAHPPVGPVAAALAAADVGAVRVARAWDRALWPHAGRGFFGFRPRIGDAVAAASGG